MVETADRHFLFLQGPHGPFFRMLGMRLAEAGASVSRVAFNAADRREWGGTGPLHPFNDGVDAFADWLAAHLDNAGVTDIVLYGDTRPIHTIAQDLARDRGLTVHCLEEGYIRPSWITYERGGTNGNSRLMSISLPRMAEALGTGAKPEAAAPATWGDANEHLWYSALYHAHCLMPSKRFNRFRGHRDMPLFSECATYWLRAAKMPLIWAQRNHQQARLLKSKKPFHLVLLQLSFDASMQVHSDFDGTAELVRHVIDAFAEGAAPDEHLVFKAHPFEDGREALDKVIPNYAAARGIGDRVLYIDGGKKLAALLDQARTAVTVNSTAAQQALWRGLPVAALGRAIYRKPGLVSQQDLTAFMRDPMRPDMRSYWLFRQFLMETSQIAGSFYAKPGLDLLLSRLPGVMLSAEDPYERVLNASQTDTQTTKTAPRSVGIAG